MKQSSLSKIFKLSAVCLSLSVSTATFAQTATANAPTAQTQATTTNGGNITGSPNIVIQPNTITDNGFRYQTPDALNWEKMNTKRDCSPAELLAGKSECFRCDPDTPNVVKEYKPELAQEMARNGGMFIYGSQNAKAYSSNNILSNGYMGKYYQAFDYKPYTGAKPSNIDTRPRPPAGCDNRTGAFSNNRDSCTPLPTYIVYRGYNLQGTNETFKPLNNRAVCEMNRPTQQANSASGATNGSGAFALAGLGLVVAGNLGKGGDWTKLPIFNSKGAFGAQNDASKAFGNAAKKLTFTATEIFACLEYYTGTNPSMCGGDHVLANKDGKAHFCRQPLQTFYNTKIQEIWCYSAPCDGVADGAFKPGTIPLRQALLMTNPFYLIGQTAPQSMRIAAQRPMTCMGL